jgi:hypothetical protein
MLAELNFALSLLRKPGLFFASAITLSISVAFSVTIFTSTILAGSANCVCSFIPKATEDVIRADKNK